MNSIISSPVFGILVSLIAFEVGLLIYRKTRITIFNPLLIAIGIIIFLLSKLNIKYEDFNMGRQYISFFLYPATVALALPVYKKRAILKADFKCIIVSNLIGQLIGIITILGLSKMFGLSDILTKSLVPKSITTPIGMAVSLQLGGIPSITVAAIILTGIFGSVVSPLLIRLIKKKDKVAAGLAIGAASHAVGTAKALEIGEVEGSMSSISMVISGIITVFLAPFLWNLCLKIFS